MLYSTQRYESSEWEKNAWLKPLTEWFVAVVLSDLLKNISQVSLVEPSHLCPLPPIDAWFWRLVIFLARE